MKYLGTKYACFLIIVTLSNFSLNAQEISKEFLYGACIYPEIMERHEWQSMLDYMKKASMNVMRVAESAWGVIHTAPEEYDFQWLDHYLEDAEDKGIKSILGTSSYVPPLWLINEHPEIITVREGQRDYPLVKKNPEITNLIYQRYVLEYTGRIADRYKNNKNVIGWQLDNEIDIGLKSYIENGSAQKAWHNWLANKFDAPSELSEKFQLDIFGLRVSSFNQIPLIRSKHENWSPVGIRFNYWQYRRDMIFDFFDRQRQALNLGGTGQWITTNWTGPWKALTNDPRAGKVLDVSGIDFYHPSDSKPGHWKHLGYQLDLNRSIQEKKGFLVMETGLGVTGNNSMNQFIDWAGGAMIQKDRFFMQNIFPAAFGATGLLYWTGNRIHGSHAPYYGGVVGWNGEPELEYPWVQEVGRFYKKWGEKLIAEPVEAAVAVFTDYDQRAALEVINHIENSNDITVDVFDIFHKMGVGVDALNSEQILKKDKLAQYALIVIPTASIMADTQIVNAFRTYVENGGKLMVSPLTDYLTENGIFQKQLGLNIQALTGSKILTTRMFGGPTAVDYRLPYVEMKNSNLAFPTMDMDGLAEFLSSSDGVEILAEFKSENTVLEGYPAITRNRIKKGEVIKLAFWPNDEFLFSLMSEVLDEYLIISEKPSQGIYIVPRSDGSRFIINTSKDKADISLKGTFKNRMDEKVVSGRTELKPYQVLWLDQE